MKKVSISVSLFLLSAVFGYSQDYGENYILSRVTKTDSDSLWYDLRDQLHIDTEEYEIEFDGYNINIWRTEEDGVQYK
jgi:hypothetical protein